MEVKTDHQLPPLEKLLNPFNWEAWRKHRDIEKGKTAPLQRFNQQHKRSVTASFSYGLIQE